jgi:hypothetical protein
LSWFCELLPRFRNLMLLAYCCTHHLYRFLITFTSVVPVVHSGYVKGFISINYCDLIWVSFADFHRSLKNLMFACCSNWNFVVTAGDTLLFHGQMWHSNMSECVPTRSTENTLSTPMNSTFLHFNWKHGYLNMNSGRVWSSHWFVP